MISPQHDPHVRREIEFLQAVTGWPITWADYVRDADHGVCLRIALSGTINDQSDPASDIRGVLTKRIPLAPPIRDGGEHG